MGGLGQVDDERSDFSPRIRDGGQRCGETRGPPPTGVTAEALRRPWEAWCEELGGQVRPRFLSISPRRSPWSLWTLLWLCLLPT